MKKFLLSFVMLAMFAVAFASTPTVSTPSNQTSVTIVPFAPELAPKLLTAEGPNIPPFPWDPCGDGHGEPTPCPQPVQKCYDWCFPWILCEVPCQANQAVPARIRIPGSMIASVQPPAKACIVRK